MRKHGEEKRHNSNRKSCNECPHEELHDSYNGGYHSWTVCGIGGCKWGQDHMGCYQGSRNCEEI